MQTSKMRERKREKERLGTIIGETNLKFFFQMN
jgi:hypothetical protein